MIWKLLKYLRSTIALFFPIYNGKRERYKLQKKKKKYKINGRLSDQFEHYD